MGKGIAIEYVPADSLVPAPYNPREMADEALKRLATLIDSHGWVDPIIARREDRLIIGGHQRLRANQIRDLPDVDVPVVFLDGIDDAHAMALNVALNNRETQGAYDFPKLADVLAEIDTGELDIPALTGFSEDDLAGLMHGLDEAQHEPDEVPEPPEDPVSRTGDRWLMGEHRLVCGDSTKADTVESVTTGESAVTITDPPYSVDYDRSHEQRGGSVDAHTGYTENDAGSILAFMLALPGDVLVMTYPVDRHLFALADTLRAAGMELRKELVWVKDTFSFWPGAKYQQRHEPILACARKGKPLGADVPANVSTVFEYARPKAHADHPTARPLDLWSELVTYHAPKGTAVFDPFSGSGTTIIACEQLGRKCYAVEIEPRYVDVAVKRWQNLTGKSATLEGDGRTFAEIEKHRITTDGRPEGQSEAALEAG